MKLITEGSGANTKYYIQLGADTASKKLLGSTKPVLLASEVSSLNAYNYICTSLANYKNLTASNFFVVFKSIVAGPAGTTNTGALTKFYNPATGNLTISAYYIGEGMKFSAGSNARIWITYDVYLIS